MQLPFTLIVPKFRLNVIGKMYLELGVGSEEFGEGERGW
jgi:hypothetical protein